jgi:hypothetical protein
MIHNTIQLNLKTKGIMVLLTLVVVVGGATMVPIQVLHAQTTPAKNVTANLGANASTGTVPKSVIATLAQPGFGNKYDLLVNGKPTPISYNIIGGSLVGMLADPARHSIDVAVNPGPGGGALEIQLPRQVIDSKTGTNTDQPFIVVLDGERIVGDPAGICVTVSASGNACSNIQGTYKESQTTPTDRVLTVLFGPPNRFIEFHGTTGMQ